MFNHIAKYCMNRVVQQRILQFGFLDRVITNDVLIGSRFGQTIFVLYSCLGMHCSFMFLLTKHMYMYVCSCTCACVHVYMYVCICMCVYVCVYVCMCMCMRMCERASVSVSVKC